MEFSIGGPAACRDGHAGTVIALVADPVRTALAHIAVEPAHRPGDARLVPMAMIGAADVSGVTLSCSLEEFGALPPFRDVEFIPYSPEFGDLGAALAMPYYGLPPTDTPVFVDVVPAGEVEIRRHEHVWASDGGIGHVEGLVIDATGAITHVLLQEGHLWGRREVAIPVSAVEGIDDEGVHVRLSKDEIGALPEIGARPPAAVTVRRSGTGGGIRPGAGCRARAGMACRRASSTAGRPPGRHTYGPGEDRYRASRTPLARRGLLRRHVTEELSA